MVLTLWRTSDVLAPSSEKRKHYFLKPNNQKALCQCLWQRAFRCHISDVLNYLYYLNSSDKQIEARIKSYFRGTDKLSALLEKPLQTFIQEKYPDY